MVLTALQLGGLFETAGEMAFVLKVVVFVYLCYWLYVTFRGVGMLFGVFLLGAAYIVFFYSISTTFLLILFLVFVMFGMHFQMLLDFGVGRLYELAGKHPPWRPEMAEQERLHQLEQKYSSGALNEGEAQELAKFWDAQGGAPQQQQMAPQMRMMRMAR